jgi:hypothetical protein
MLVFLGCYNRIPKTEWLKEQRLIFSQSRGWKLQGQGSRRVELMGASLLTCGWLGSHVCPSWSLLLPESEVHISHHSAVNLGVRAGGKKPAYERLALRKI